jgi:MSHA biogenesis protein MshN
MSLINQMLRDLDARRGPASSVETSALQGMGLSSTNTGAQHIARYRAGWAVGLVLAGILIQQGYQAWSHTQAHPEVLLPVAATEVKPPSSSVAAPAQPATPVTAVKEEPDLAVPEPVNVNIPPASASPVTQVPATNTAATEAPARKIIKPLTPEQKAQRQFNHAQTLLAKGNYRTATNALHSALDLDPMLDDARIQLAALYLEKGHVDTARQLLETGRQLKPFHSGMTIAYVRLLADQGEYLSALELLENDQYQGTFDAETFALSASLHYQLRQYQKAVSRYREALARRPAQGVWWMGLGVSLENIKQRADALEAYRRASTTLQETALQTFVTGRISALSGQME